MIRYGLSPIEPAKSGVGRIAETELNLSSISNLLLRNIRSEVFMHELAMYSYSLTLTFVAHVIAMLSFTLC